VGIRGAAPLAAILAAGFSGISPAAAAGHVKCLGKNATITSSAPVVQDTSKSDVIVVPGAGPHTIEWSGGSDTVCGTGNDTIDYSHIDAATNGYVVSFMHTGPNQDLVFHEPRVVLTVNSRGNTVKTLIGKTSLDKATGVTTIIGTPNNDFLFGDPLNQL